MIQYNRTGDQLRKHTQKSAQINKTFLRLHLTSVNVNGISCNLESIETDAQRQRYLWCIHTGQLHTASPVRQPDGQMIPVGYKKIHIFKYKQHAKAIHKHDHQANPLTFPAFSPGIPGQCVMDHQ